MLEGEVSALRDQCNGDGTCCSAQVTGEVGTKPFCNGHGNFSTGTCGCVCEPGWKGPNCSEPECPGNCQDRGRCVDGKCECFKGFSGEDCTLEVCPVDCGDHGRCVGGACVCSDGYLGEDCSQTKCLNNCLGRGRCDDGDCVCDEPWTGFDCSELICPKDCYDRGRCDNGTCYCDEGFTGKDCGERTCPNDCQGNGFCVDGRCACTAGYTGDDCSQLTCLNDCNGRGSCYNGMCICDSGYQGEDCSQLACLNNCNNRGQCINGGCSCDVGFKGDDCSELSCPSDCLQRGRCVNGQCVCEEGFAGEDCSIRTCPSNCYGRGECVDGRCVCHAGFTGEDCGELSCPNSCRNRGRCVDGQCVCDEGFTGEDCGQKACPNDCLARGYCVDGRCVCQEGYSGDDCSVLACPDNCNNRGRCVNGRCTCESGYEGESCAELSCLNNCHDKGRCVNGQCVCDEGYIGDDCSGVSPPKDLTVDGVTSDTVDLRWDNEMLVTEYLVTYVPTSPGGLHQEFTVTGDKNSATVKELEPGIEYQINVYAVLSNKRSIPVSARVATELPQPQGLKFKSVRETSVVVTWDQLDIPFDGWEIYFRNTKEENGKVVSTLPPSQNEFVQSGLGPGQEYEVSINIIKNNTRGPQTSCPLLTETFMAALLHTIRCEIRPVRLCKSSRLGLARLGSARRSWAKQQSLCLEKPFKIDGPRQVEVKDVTDSSALVSWSQPVAPVDRVTMFYGPTSDPSDESSAEIPAPDKQYSIDNLRPDTEYRVSLISRSGDASSDPVTTTFTTGNEADVGSYRVKYSPISGATHGEEVFPRGPGGTTRATITGLKPGTEYGIGVTAVKNERESLPATTNAATDIDPPRSFEEVESTETSVTLRWQKPRAKVSGYRLVYVSRDGQVEEVEIPATATSYVVSNLTPGMSYTHTLTAERGHKSSTPVTLTASTATFTFYLADSDDRELTTPTGSEDNVISFAYLDPSESQFSGTEPVDERKGALTVSGITSDGFDVSWRLKARRVYDHFVVQYKDAQRSWPAREVRLPGDATGCRIEGLKASTEYQIKLYGKTSRQRSALLDAVAVTAPEPTSADVLTLSIKDATTSSPLSALDNQTVQTLRPLNTEAPPTPGVEPEPEPEPEPESSDRVAPRGTSRVSLAWSAPDGAFDSFVVELSSPSGATQEELSPMVVNLTISDITWDGFTASWSPSGGGAEEFDSFVIEVTNLENYAESQNLTLSGGALSLAITGLHPNTSYMVGLYGMYQGSFIEPVYSDATTVNQPLVGKLYISNLTSESFSILWNATEGEFDGFILEIIDSDWLMEPKEYNISRDVTSHHVSGLRPSTDYIAYLYGTFKGARTRAAMGRALPGDERSTVMAGLKASTSYDIKLYASAGGHNTQPLFAVATTEDVPQLGAVAASSVSPHNLSVYWSTVSGHFDGFVVRVSDSEQQSDPLEFRLPSESRNVTVSNLMDATGYDIELYASLPKVENLTISNITPYGFRVSWEVKQQQQQQQQQQQDLPPSSVGFSSFQIVVTDSGWLLEPQEFTVPGKQSHLDIWGLITGIGYEVRLTGVSESGLLSRPLTAVAATEAEPEVEHLFVSDIAADGFRLSWTADEDLFDRFVIKLRDSKRVAHPQEFNVRGDERTQVLTGLMSGTEYEIELYGVSLDQRSQPIFGVAQTGLSTPRGLHFTEVTDSSAVVHWSSPRSPVDSYRITYMPFEGGSPMLVTVDGDVFEALLPNMIPGKTYQVTVSAVKGLEESDPSTDTVTTALDRPQGLTAVNVTDTSALLLWQPSVATVDGYVITYSAETVSSVVEHVSGNTVEFEMGSLVPGTHYTVGVHAMKQAQKSESAVTEFTTGVDPPRDLTAVNIQTEGATLTWKPPQAAVTGYTLTFSSADGTIRLSGSTEYTVKLQAIAGAQRSRHVTTVFTTIGQLYRLPRDCAQVLLNGEATSGVFTVYVGGEESQPLRVYCDMSTDGGGWMNYTSGFGNMNDEFWLGLSNLHKITSSGHYELRVDMRDQGETAYAQYDKFSVAEPRTRYKVYIGAYSGTAGDSMTYHQGRPFSTYDNDNDIAVTNCALSYKGAFWYKNCHRGINWFHWRGHEHSIEFAEMKIRPVNFRNFESRKKRS
ncbi:hypothetical protein INR49_022584 [Caranx melampygus]|nr:hypothetical protein INR49_022584 [Caranx melampygus]